MGICVAGRMGLTLQVGQELAGSQNQELGQEREGARALVLRGESYCSLDSMRAPFPLKQEGRWL